MSCQKQLDICISIVKDLHFLHTRTSPIVHRDLTDKNILLAADGLVKIEDLTDKNISLPSSSSTTRPSTVDRGGPVGVPHCMLLLNSTCGEGEQVYMYVGGGYVGMDGVGVLAIPRNKTGSAPRLLLSTSP